MLTSLALFFAASMAMVQVVQAQEPVTTTFWVHRAANIRTEPTTAGGNSTIIATTPRGEQLSVVGEVDGEIPTGWQNNDVWYIVQLNDDEVGYVYSALVARNLPAPQGDEGSLQDEGTVLGEPLLTGSESFKTKIRASLRLLRDRDPDSYAFVNEWLDGIVEGFYTCKIVRGTSIASIGISCMRSGKVILAVALVHEACHVMRSESGLVSSGLLGERACLGMELETLRTIDPHNHNLARGERMHRNIEEAVCQWWRPTFNKQQCQALP